MTDKELKEALMTPTAKAIIKEILAHTDEHAILTSAKHFLWYCGITNDPDARKSAHKSANEKDPHAWMHWYAYSRRIAEAIETYCHNTLGMQYKDTKGGVKDNSRWVYVYKERLTVFH